MSEQPPKPDPAKVRKHKTTTFMGALARGAADLEEEPPVDASAEKDNARALQIRMVVLSAILGLLFAGGLLGAALNHLGGFEESLKTTAGFDDATIALHQGSKTTFVIILSGVSLGFLVVNTLLVLFVTERLIGPVRRFHRHVTSLADGDYSTRTNLREHDAFREVAADLNRLAGKLEQG